MEREDFENFNFCKKNKPIFKNLEYTNGFEIFSKAQIKDKKEQKFKNIENFPAKHRYCHYEILESGKNKIATYILFNPSNATPEKDDPTVKACREIAKKEGFGEMIIVNLFSERSTKSVMFNKTYMNNSKNNETNMEFMEELFRKIDIDSNIFIKAWGFAKEADYKEIISQVEGLIAKDAIKKIIGIKEIAINMNHHPGCIKWIGGTKFAELRDEFTPTELDV